MTFELNISKYYLVIQFKTIVRKEIKNLLDPTQFDRESNAGVISSGTAASAAPLGFHRSAQLAARLHSDSVERAPPGNLSTNGVQGIRETRDCIDQHRLYMISGEIFLP